MAAETDAGGHEERVRFVGSLADMLQFGDGTGPARQTAGMCEDAIDNDSRNRIRREDLFDKKNLTTICWLNIHQGRHRPSFI